MTAGRCSVYLSTSGQESISKSTAALAAAAALAPAQLVVVPAEQWQTLATQPQAQSATVADGAAAVADSTATVADATATLKFSIKKKFAIVHEEAAPAPAPVPVPEVTVPEVPALQAFVPGFILNHAGNHQLVHGAVGHPTTAMFPMVHGATYYHQVPTMGTIQPMSAILVEYVNSINEADISGEKIIRLYAKHFGADLRTSLFADAKAIKQALIANIQSGRIGAGLTADEIEKLMLLRKACETPAETPAVVPVPVETQPAEVAPAAPQPAKKPVTVSTLSSMLRRSARAGRSDSSDIDSDVSGSNSN